MTIGLTVKGHAEFLGGIVEWGEFTLSGTVTTGNVTPSTSLQPEIVELYSWDFASDSDTAIAANKTGPTTIGITTATTDDTGDYWLFGRAA